MKVASVIKNYVSYMEKHYHKMYADIIYPAIYEKEYTDGVQMSIDDEEDKSVIDKANVAAKYGTRFQRGNTQGVRFAPKHPIRQARPIAKMGGKKGADEKEKTALPGGRKRPCA